VEIRLDPSVTPLDLNHTLGCGQVFRWAREGDWWYGVAGGKALKIGLFGDRLRFQASPTGGDTSHFVGRYFRLDDDLPLIASEINRDEHIDAALQAFHGLRIVRQEPWECLVSYVCATYKNIPAIRGIIRSLSQRFGERVTMEGRPFHAFPRPGDLAEADPRELRKCGLGFRAEYISEISKLVAEGEFGLEGLMRVGYEEARRRLISLPGVGPKVADCVLLFSLDRLEAFPVDVWVRRIVLESYPDHFEQPFIHKVLNRKSITPGEYQRIGSFGRRYFGRYAGYAQEYLYHYERSRLRQKPLSHQSRLP